MYGRNGNGCQQLVSRHSLFSDEIKQEVVKFRPEAAATIESSQVGEATGKL